MNLESSSAVRPSLALLSLALLACGGGTTTGVPEDCEVMVEGECYAGAEEACEAAGCPSERCLVLDSYPGQVSCEDEATPEDEGVPDAPAGDTPVASGDGATPRAVPEGGACTGPGQCAPGLGCQGAQGCDASWTCQPMRPCTRDLRPYCGCDGQTFRSSGSCPGRPYASRGPCGG